MLQELRGHKGSVLGVVWSAERQQILSCGQDRTLRMWDVKEGRAKLKRTIRAHSDFVFSACFSPGGEYIVSASQDKQVKVWDSTTTRLLRVLRHATSVYSACMAPGGDLVASVSEDATVELWKWKEREAENRRLGTLSLHTDPPYCVQFSPDGKTLISAGMKLVMSHVPSLATKWAVSDAHEKPVTSALFAREGSQVVTAATDLAIIVWDAGNGTPLGVITDAHAGGLLLCRISVQGETCLSGSWDENTDNHEGRLKVWKLPGGAASSLTPPGAACLSLLVFVRSDAGQKTPVDVEVHSTVGDLIRTYEDLSKMTEGVIMFQEKTLSPADTLADLGVCPETVVEYKGGREEPRYARYAATERRLRALKVGRPGGARSPPPVTMSFFSRPATPPVASQSQLGAILHP